MKNYRYVICDVFTNRPLTGNQLAVFTNAHGLDAETMQALAREMNFSETTFLLRPEQGGDARVRIFTPRKELPFAGHPTLGTAFVLAAPLQRPLVQLETGVGIIPVRFEIEGPRVTFGWMKQPLPTWRTFDRDREPELLAALGVSRSELPVTVYDNGMRHLFVALSAPEQVAALKPDFGKLAELTDAGVNVFAGQGTTWKTRMFHPTAGVNEDPATGSAAGPLAVHVARHGRAPYGEELVIDQGSELLRPSRLHARVEGEGDQLSLVEVGGAAVIVARGEFAFP